MTRIPHAATSASPARPHGKAARFVVESTSHTPGPWQTAPNYPHGMTAIIDSDGATKPYTLIAKAERAEDARLIAAAPELLEALEHAREVFVTIHHYGEAGPVLRKLDAAIAKAVQS